MDGRHKATRRSCRMKYCKISDGCRGLEVRQLSEANL